MTTNIHRDRVVSQTEYFDDESILDPITKTTNKGPVAKNAKTVNKIARILLYLDDPWIAEAALSYIEDYISMLAPEVKVEIYFLQVIAKMTHYRLGDGVVTTVPYTEEEIKQTTNEAMDYINKATEPLRSKGVTVVAKVGTRTDASKEIVKTAEEINANLIVMFTHRKSWLNRLNFGSVADKVLWREKYIPIMIVKDEHLMSQLDCDQRVRNG